MRKYIKLYACIYNNVGDDLMVDILLKRYPTYTFFYSNQYYEASNKFLKYKNFINLYSVYKKWDILNHLCNKLTFNIDFNNLIQYNKIIKIKGGFVMSRPIVIEFSGLPNSGKTTLLCNMKKYVKNNNPFGLLFFLFSV